MVWCPHMQWKEMDISLPTSLILTEEKASLLNEPAPSLHGLTSGSQVGRKQIPMEGLIGESFFSLK